METFVLRLVRLDPEVDGDLHGKVEHVASGVTVTFQTTQEMVAAITELALAAGAASAVKPPPERV